MITKFALSDYINRAMACAVYDKLEDGRFSGRIPACKGVIAFAPSLRECEDELRSTLEDWILVGLKMKHFLPVKLRSFGLSSSRKLLGIRSP